MVRIRLIRNTDVCVLWLTETRDLKLSFLIKKIRNSSQIIEFNDSSTYKGNFETSI